VHGFQQRARSQEALGEEDALLLRDPLDRGMQIGGVLKQLADLLPQDLGVQELLAVVPLVQGLGVVLSADTALASSVLPTPAGPSTSRGLSRRLCTNTAVASCRSAMYP